MFGRRAEQQNLFSADTQYLDFVGKDQYCSLSLHYS